MEDGEIQDGTYHPAFEWPVESSATQEDSAYLKTLSPPPTGKSPSTTSILRLLVTQTSILPRKQKVIIPDGYAELQFGRDVAPPGSETPRIRLKEMEVSKVHATVYWDKELRAWSIVDMGSKHGTFVRSFIINSRDRISLDARPGEDIKGMRLSLCRTASIPRRLYHLDSVTIGSTTFVVHVHEDQLPCIECTAGVAREVPLFSVSRQEDAVSASKRSRDAAGIDHGFAAGSARDHKKVLTMLKHSLLSRHDGEAPGDVSSSDTHYVDRSARRRALHPASRPDAPGTPNGISTPMYQPYQLLVAPVDALPPPTSTSRPPAVEPAAVSVPLSENNVGHRLLMKQGWQPGKALGLPNESNGEPGGLTQPIEVSAYARRAGLGMSVQKSALPNLAMSLSLDWKEGAKQRRWEALREDG